MNAVSLYNIWVFLLLVKLEFGVFVCFGRFRTWMHKDTFSRLPFGWFVTICHANDLHLAIDWSKQRVTEKSITFVLFDNLLICVQRNSCELTGRMFDRLLTNTHQYRHDWILPDLSESKHHRNKQLSNDRPYHQCLWQRKANVN